MKKIALVAYNGELMCFSHVMLYALDFAEKGYEVRVVLEGAATALITELNIPGKPFNELYSKMKDQGLISAVCLACSRKMGSFEEAERQGLNLVGDMQGHPSLEGLVAEGFTILSF